LNSRKVAVNTENYFKKSKGKQKQFNKQIYVTDVVIDKIITCFGKIWPKGMTFDGALHYLSNNNFPIPPYPQNLST
jgi:hypothetical protein